MKLGYFTMPLHPVGKDWGQTLAEDREAILLADRLGYEEAFIGEHVTDLAETITSCLIFIATPPRSAVGPRFPRTSSIHGWSPPTGPSTSRAAPARVAKPGARTGA